MAREKILVVDDEKSVRDAFVASFEEYNIVTVSSGQEALDILTQPNDIDLVVLDVMMYGISGIELLQKIKKINPHQKVVIITGCGSKGIVIEALRARADEYIDKPFDVHQTREIFEKLLHQNRTRQREESPDSQSKVKQAKRFIQKEYTKSIHLNDIAKEIFLSPKYFSHLFKKKTGKGFSRYRTELRMNMAKQLLEETEVTLSHIAYKVGYQNPESFMKAFKKASGLTPSQYRRSKRNKKSREGIRPSKDLYSVESMA